MGRAKIVLSFESVLAQFDFPIGTSLLGVSCTTEENLKGELTLFVEHPALPKVLLGEEIPRVSPAYKTLRVSAFRDWGW